MFRNRGEQIKKASPNDVGDAKRLRNAKSIRGIIYCLILMLILFAAACSGSPQSGTTTGNSVDQSPTATPPHAGIADENNRPMEPTGETPSTAVPSQDSQGSDSPQGEPGAVKLPDNSYFEIHYIDVGQADAALVLCDDSTMLIDGGNVADSSLIYAYLKEHSIEHLDYIVCTHAHEDHVGGLAGALNYATVGVVYCPVRLHETDAFSNFVKYLDKQDVSITVPEAGNIFNLGSAEATIIGPVKRSDDTNNTSIVLRIVYGNTSFLFTGDAEREEEQDILDAGYTLSSTVLKVGHHGSANSTTYPFLREIMPKYAVISVGLNNSYGHPTEDALSRLRDAEVKVYRTDMQGHIICISDGENVSFSVSKNSDADTFGLPQNSIGNQNGGDATGTTGTTYVLNTNTHKFHYPTCSSVDSMKESNKSIYTGSREEVISMGFSPCGRCHP